jgi:simple sugar transport system permease protein
MLISFIAAAVIAGTPLLFGTLGAILNEKVGCLNLGIEGLMAMGAFAGFMGGYYSDNLFAAILCAFAAGAFGALIYAVLTITFMANQNVTGLTLSIFGVGLSNFCGEYLLSASGNAALKLPPNANASLRNLNIGLSSAPVIGKLFFSYNIFVYFGTALAILCWFYLYKTRAGLNSTAIGENPAAAEASGVKVTKYKYLNVVIGGGICGIGGAYASLVICGGVWLANSVNGLGWISVALVIFAVWNPAKAIYGSFIFGAFSVLKYYAPKQYFTLPNALYDALPFLATALALIASSYKNKKENLQPESCGVNYFREER